MTHARIVSSRLDIDLPLADGITALLGPAGAGKTVILASVAGFTRPERGRILIGDAIVFDGESGVNLAPRRRRCAWVGACDALFPRLTVRQNLLFAADRWARLERTRRVAEMLERFELADALEMRPRALPPARRLRVEVARALMTEPKVLLVDDRSADGAGERVADEALLRLVRGAFSGAMLWVTGNLDLCYSSADRLALLEGGRVVGYGPARELMEYPESVEAARLVGISNLYPATIAGLDPGRNQSRLECADFSLTGPYLKGHFKGDRVWVGIRAEDLRVHTDELEPGVNFVAVHLLRMTERPRTVRLEFARGIAAEISREQYAKQKDNKGWQVELPPAALRVF
jgi:ABC-type sulfate/molybdate transport systems ATPase subunit